MTTIDFFPIPLLFGLIWLVYLLVSTWSRHHHQVRLASLALFWLYIYLVIDVVFFPLTISEGWPAGISSESIAVHFAHLNLIPFYFGNLFDASLLIVVKELAGNILLTAPFGFLLPFLVWFQTRRIPWIALLTGVVLELCQLILGLLNIRSQYGFYHSVDINDVLLNGLGVLLGYVLFQTFIRLFRGFDPQHVLVVSGTKHSV